jgi:death on curing protein
VTRYLSVEQALRIARAAVGGPVKVRDIGLLEAAVHRPRASVLGQDAYPGLLTKAAALLHSLASNHALVDGNKRLAWLATYVFLAKNGIELDPDDDEAFELIMDVAAGEVGDVGEIATALASWQVPAPETFAADLERFPADLSDRLE